MKVVICQRVIPHYRVEFFRRLYNELLSNGIHLQVLYGNHGVGRVPESVDIEEPWALKIKNIYINIFGSEVVLQNFFSASKDADLVILEHAARIVGNYPLLIRRIFLGVYFLAFWGHGANFQSNSTNSFVERVKRLFLNQVDWWFAYTENSQSAVSRAGFPAGRITVVQNAIDDSEFRAAMQAVVPGEVATLRREYRIAGEHVALYCGGMYPDKRLDFLMDACVRVRELIPDFEVVFIGSGPDQHRVEVAAERHAWMHYAGPVFGAGRAPFFAMSQALLMPGLVGLAIVDSFVAGVPLFTTDIPIHSPEIAYLIPGVNGIMSRFDVEDYARTVADCLNAPTTIERLRQGCLESASVYTLDNMVRNFAGGIEDCLAAERR